MFASTMVKDSVVAVESGTGVAGDSDWDSLEVVCCVSTAFNICPPVSVEVALRLRLNMDIVVGECRWGNGDEPAHRLSYACVGHAASQEKG
jgi:hypothetical protein